MNPCRRGNELPWCTNRSWSRCAQAVHSCLQQLLMMLASNSARLLEKQQNGSQKRPMDKIFSRTNVPMPIGISINNIPMKLSTLNWGDKSRFSCLDNKNCVLFRRDPKLKKTAIFLALCDSERERASRVASLYDGNWKNQLLCHFWLLCAFKIRKNVNFLFNILLFFCTYYAPPSEGAGLIPPI